MAASITHITQNSGTGAVAVTATGHAAGDWLVLTCESSASTTAAGTPGTPTDFEKVFERTQGAGATGVTTLTVFIKLSDGTEGSITVGTAGNHLYVSLDKISGATQVRSELVIGTGNGGASGSVSVNAITTPSDDCRVTWHLSTTVDAVSNNFTGYVNGNLSGLVEVHDVSTNSGAGGGVGVGGGVKATAGSTGATTVTNTPNLQWNAVHIAWPNPAPTQPDIARFGQVPSGLWAPDYMIRQRREW